jgi:hypothetical protein
MLRVYAKNMDVDAISCATQEMEKSTDVGKMYMLECCLLLHILTIKTLNALNINLLLSTIIVHNFANFKHARN